MRIRNLFSKENIKELFCIVLSAALLVLAFPKTDLWILAWTALVPMLFALDGKSFKGSFKVGFLTGLFFFWGTLYWFIHVTFIGAALLIGYLALYFGIFGAGCYIFRRVLLPYKMVLFASLWVVCEYARAHLLTGFGWACLGHSQYKNILMIQIADVTGVFGVSFIVVMVNVLIKELLNARQCSEQADKTALKQASVFALAVMAAAAFYGGAALKKEDRRAGTAGADKTLSVAVVQANIAQHEKWNEASWPLIMKKYADLTAQAAEDDPGLIVWPETAFPGFLWEDIGYFTYLQDFVGGINIPLLFGSVVHEEDRYYNSAVLLSASGGLAGTAHKLHLVPFGEYVPFRKFIPLVAEFIPIEDFTAGQEFKNFTLPESEKNKFSSLICFEDTVPFLSRQFTKRGSGLLVNLTNDAWFEDTSAPFMHLQSSIFRSIENRRYLVRAANTGVSGFIDPAGRVAGLVRDTDGKPTYVQGVVSGKVQFRYDLSFYTKFGDVFTLLCVVCILGGVWMARAENILEK